MSKYSECEYQMFLGNGKLRLRNKRKVEVFILDLIVIPAVVSTVEIYMDGFLGSLGMVC
jgi:hypothetical protein